MILRLQIVYPALEYKVQNVTQPYSVEHGEEVSCDRDTVCYTHVIQELLICPDFYDPGLRQPPQH